MGANTNRAFTRVARGAERGHAAGRIIDLLKPVLLEDARAQAGALAGVADDRDWRARIVMGRGGRAVLTSGR